MKDLFLSVDNAEPVSMTDFLEANIDDGESTIDPQDIAQIENLQIGQSHFIPALARWCEIKRVEEVAYAH